MKNISVNHKYKILQGLFWMMFCVGGGFVSLNLQSRGFNNKQIGMVPATFCTVSALLQPTLGRMCDKSNKITWKNMILFLSFPFLFACILMALVPGKVIGIICVGLLLALVNTTSPFINSAVSSYEREGTHINFGVARGIGSATYAIVALILGDLAARWGTNVISITGIIVSGLFILTVLSLPNTPPVGIIVNKDSESGTSIISFFQKYPAFVIMFLAFVLELTCHNILGTYQLQIIQFFGGTSKEFGISIAIMAIVEVPVLFLYSKMLKLRKPEFWMVFASCGYGIRCLCFALAGSVNAIYFVQITQMIGFAVFASASVYYTIDKIKVEDQVTGQAMMTMVLACGSVLGSLSGGFILDSYGVKPMLWVNFIISCVGILLAFISTIVSSKEKG